tara:strand:+ start:1359 stop:2057 length:699 start_codon:yes stop_codon:yes gene_type:complete
MFLNDRQLIENYYRKLSLFSSLNDDDFKKLINKSKVELYNSGSNIIEQGDVSNSVYFLIYGSVHVIDYSRLDRAVSYASLKDGDMFGEMSAVDGFPRSAWVSAVTQCQVICLSGETFLEIIKSKGEVCFTLLKQFSTRIRHADERISEVSVLGVEQRACVEIIRMLKMNEKDHNTYIIENMPTQANFASLIGSTRETVSRIFTKLRLESILIKTDDGYIVPNKKALERKAFY